MRRLSLVHAVAAVLLGGVAVPDLRADPVPVVFPVTVTASPLAAGKPYKFTFTLYDAADGGTKLWSESKSYVLPAAKKITHQLGSVNPAGNPISPVLFDRQLWVEPSVGTKKFARVKLGVAPYAVRSELAGNIEGQIAAGQVDATGAASGDVLTANGDGGAGWLAPSGGGGDILSVNTPPGSGLAGGATSGEVTLSVDTAAIQSRIATGCAPGSSVREVNPNGTVVCEPDDVNGPHTHSGGDITSGTVATARLIVGATPGSVAAGEHHHDGAYVASTDGRVVGSLLVEQTGYGRAGEFVLVNAKSISPALSAGTDGLGAAVEATASGAGPAGSFATTNPENPGPALVVATAGKGNAGEFQGDLLATGTVVGQRFVGDGSGLTNVTANRPFWQEITTTSHQMERNGNYIVNSPEHVTLTLPSAASFTDTLRVASVGSGGWTIAQNAGQTIAARGIPSGVAAAWTARESVRTWQSVASSADGTKLIAAANGSQLFTSTDGGATWIPRETAREWIRVASSADGTRLVACVSQGQIYVSTDSGMTWTPRESARDWASVASSADGMRLVAGVYNMGYVYVSDNGGQTWTERGHQGFWGRLASSADGMKLVAVDGGGPRIYTSTDGGATWVPRESFRAWGGVASSADGVKLVAVDYGYDAAGGRIYTSTDAGVTWTPRATDHKWWGVASSADGTRLVAVVENGKIFTSPDSGVSWVPHESDRKWWTVASSSDGSRLLAAVYAGRLYASTPGTTPGLSGSLSGSQHDAVELIFVGNGTFSVLSHEGDLTVK